MNDYNFKTRAFKQIASAIEANGSVEGLETKYFNLNPYRETYMVKIDGEWYRVSATSWNKLWKNFRFTGAGMEDSKSGIRTISYIIRAKAGL